MSKLVPLLQEGATPLEQELLESARKDLAGGDAARARTLAAARSVLQAGAIVGAAGTGVAGWKWATALGLTTTKAAWLGGVGVVVVLGSAGLVASVVSTQGKPAAAPVTSVAPAATSAVVAPRSLPRASTVVASATPSVAPTPTLSAPGPSARTPTAAATPERLIPTPSQPTATPIPQPSPSPSTLGVETALLRSVREALATSNPDGALGQLDRFDARFPSGVLAEEAADLRVEALVAAGNRTEARRAEAAFEARFPQSSYTPRLRALLQKNP